MKSANAERGPEVIPQAVRRFLDVLYQVGGIACMVSVAALLVVIGYSVWGRYVLNDPPTWAENSALLYMLVIAFVGGGVVVREQGHLRMVFVVKAFPVAARRWIELSATVLVLAFAVAMAVGGIQAAVQVWDVGDPMLPISRGTYYVPIAICGVMIVLFELEQLVLLIARWKTYTAEDSIESTNL